jgi:four helix bundle protein
MKNRNRLFSAATRPSATRPSATRPSATRSSATRSSATRSSATRPSATRPSATRPSATRPSATRSSATRSSATRSSATRSSATRSSATRSSANRPSAPAPAPVPAPVPPRLPQSARRLDAYKVALELYRFCQPFIAKTRRVDERLADQLQKALPSMPQNLCEGRRRTGNDRYHLLTVALGSAEEVRAIFDILLIQGVMTSDEQQHADELADRFCAMVFRLARRI